MVCLLVDDKGKNLLTDYWTFNLLKLLRLFYIKSYWECNLALNRRISPQGTPLSASLCPSQLVHTSSLSRQQREII